MKDKVDEVGAKEEKSGRTKALEAWAQLIYSRPPAEQDPANETVGCGGSSVPKDTLALSDPRAVRDRSDKLKALKQANEAAQVETRRTQDSVQSGAVQTNPGTTPPAVEKKVEAARQAQQASRVEQGQQADMRQVEQREAVREQAEVVEQQAVQQGREAQAVEPPVFAQNSKEADDQRVQLLSLTQAAPRQDGADKVEESPPLPPVNSAEEAAMLAALRSGVGANPQLVAAAYVEAAAMPGVAGTLQAGIYQDFVIAL